MRERCLAVSEAARLRLFPRCTRTPQTWTAHSEGLLRHRQHASFAVQLFKSHPQGPASCRCSLLARMWDAIFSHNVRDGDGQARLVKATAPRLRLHAALTPRPPRHVQGKAPALSRLASWAHWEDVHNPPVVSKTRNRLTRCTQSAIRAQCQ